MALLSKLSWYRHRIAAMSAHEMVHRAVEVAKRKHDRLRSQRLLSPQQDGELPAIPGLREGLLALQPSPALLAQWQEQATEAQSGHFFLLGQQWPVCQLEKKWHFDPVTERCWPDDRFCFDINFRHAEGWGDVKYVWELNRLQYLQPVAALAFLQKNETLAAWCLAEIENWSDHNPPHLGINWASGIELALRAVSMITVTTWVGEKATAVQRSKIHSTLHAHGQWLARYPSAFSSANNHRTSEGLGLFIIGALCPQFSESATWKNQGWDLLCETARLQILSDGIGAEQTPNYTAVVLEMLLLGLHLALAQQVPVPDYYVERITLAGEVLRWFTDEAGNQPRIGDDDNARVLGNYRRDETYVRSILGCVAAVTGRADLSPPGDTLHLRHAAFGIPPAPVSGPQGVRVFSEGGYTVGRHDTANGQILLAMDHGYLGYLSIAAHGHADALSLWLHIDGQPVLVDAGTYLYHSGGTWRNHFRGTGAHNTLRLNGIDSSTISGHFNWSHKAHAALIGSEFRPDHWWAEAEHDGYMKKFSVRHRRRLHVVPSRGFTVEDRLIGDGDHSAEINFLLHPSLAATSEGGEIIITKLGETLLRIRHERDLLAAIYVAGDKECGWYSPTFAIKEPATRIAFSGTLAQGRKAITHFLFGNGHGGV